MVLGRYEYIFGPGFILVRGEGGGVDKEFSHIECLWEVDFGLVFLFAVGPFVFESLEVKDQYLGCLVDLDNFFS